MAKDNNGVSIDEFSGGLHTDNSPIDQPKGTYRFALNAIDGTTDGNQRKLSNEQQNLRIASLGGNLKPIGQVYTTENNIGIISMSDDGKQDIGILGSNDVYTSYVNTTVLGLKITNQCDIIFRIRRNKERIIYWVDGLHKARKFNFDRVASHYNEAYKNYLKVGDFTNPFVGEKWDASTFNLIREYKSIPFFNSVSILETGNILPGSYNFAIQYIDEDLNPTEWITTSNTVNIYNSSSISPYETIRGSRNVDNISQSFPRANKSIRLTLGNLDVSFPYYRIAIIRAAGNDGNPDKVLASDLQSTSESNFLYTGNDGNLKDIQIGDILIDNEVILAPKHIEQIENRLILANTQGKQLNLCEFQKYASKIASDLVTKEVLLNNIQSDANVKNAKSTFLYGGYMPGEVHSFGIVYVFPDYLTPVYHIPGKHVSNTTSLMKYHEIEDRYLDQHNCSTNNFWGKDAKGHNLVGNHIRHHRFPFRKEVNKPLISRTTTTSNLTKYRLKLTITLNPAWTGGTVEYPKNTAGDSIVIGATINYTITGSSNLSSINLNIIDTDVLTPLLLDVYDDSAPLDIIGGVHYSLNADSELTSYQTTGNHRFILTETYESYIASTSNNNDKAEIFGIKFSGIERPHPDCIGFYVVRNEKTDDDKIVVDNAIFGTMTEFEQYKSFGLLSPKQYYTADNCGRLGLPDKTLNFYNKGSWFFNPEFQFSQKKTEYDDISIEGVYTESSMNMPTISDTANSACNGGPKSSALLDINAKVTGGSKGVYINDVQAGTSYNADINKKKDKDDDGFDLIVGYRNVNFNFSLDTGNVYTLPTKTRTLFLSAASYQAFQSDVFYNVSIDNKIGMHLTDTAIPTNYFRNTVNNTNNLLYGSLIKNNNSSYSNFIVRPYYKEHNNPIMFGNSDVVNNIEIFNGDADISAMSIVSTIFYDIVVADRPKKSSIWKIIVGVALLAGAIVATIVTAGATSGAIPTVLPLLVTLAVSYGQSLIMSGIKFEQMKSMVDIDYEKGLKDTVTDGGVYETVRENISVEDDTIRWFADRISNIYIESCVPVGLRSGLTSSTTDFVNAPANYDEQQFRNYLTEKLTTVDRDKGSGRIYKGFAMSEVYDINKDYMRFNKQKLFIHLPTEYDCCSDVKEVYPLRRWYSEQSFQEEKTDNYAVFLPNSYSDLEGEHGEITGLFRLNKNLYCHTEEGLWLQPANLQERVTDEIVSFIGTGEFLSIPPRPEMDDKLGGAGSQHKWATLKTEFGVFFVNEIKHTIFIKSDRPKSINEGLSSYFQENIKSFLVEQLYSLFNIKFPNSNNPANINGTGYLATYDDYNKRIIITKRDYLVRQDKIGQLVIVEKIPLEGTAFAYSKSNATFYNGTEALTLDNIIFFEDKGFTLSYSVRAGRANWVSWHSYIPTFYLRGQDRFYAFINNDDGIWRFNSLLKYTTYFGKTYPFIIEYVMLSGLKDNILRGIVLQTLARRWSAVTKQYIEEKFITFNKITVNNTRQCSGELQMVVKDTQPTPSQWYKQAIVNTSDILITKKDDWYLNNLRDIVVDRTVPMFTAEWDQIKESYFIDKIVNQHAISQSKKWNEIQRFSDKFASIRLKFDIFDDVNLIVNYTIQFEKPYDR